jgi:DNA-directed RNA polymerase specialized sigma subunit
MAGYQEADLQAWQAWKRQPNDTTLQTVLDRLDPIIQTEVNRWVGTLARPALETEAKLLAVEAIQSFRPSGGASLATHVTNRLKKLSRISYTHQNIARIPEYQTLKFRTFADAQAKLMDKHGREPTHDELADELNWSKSALNNYQGSLRREFVESGDLPPFFDKDEGDSGTGDFIYHDLAPLQKKIFEHTTGYGGAKVMDNAGMMKKLKLTQGQLSYQKRLLTQNFGNIQGKKV